MLAADAGVVTQAAVECVTEPTNATPALPTAIASNHQIVFIDSAVEDFGGLMVGMSKGTEIVLIDQGSDGIQQITRALAPRQNIQTIHLITHGSGGMIQLGGRRLDAQSLQDARIELEAWSNALTATADILVYGCETGSGQEGDRFLKVLSQITHADVAASTNRTGHSDHDADWVLEKQVGPIESAIAVSATAMHQYQSYLPISIRAAGVEGDERMELRIDGNTVRSTDHVGTGAYDGSFRTFTYGIDGIDVDRISIAFTNDRWDPENNIDSNLRIDNITVDSVVYETEDSNVFSTGTWKPEDGIVPGFRNSEFLHTNGSFQFASGDPGGGGTRIDVKAGGDTGEERMRIAIDGQIVATFNVGINDAIYSFQADETVTADRVRVVFDNDAIDSATGADRNLTVDYLALDGVKYETEASDVFSTGTWKPADGIVSGFRHSDTLHSDGYFQYAAGGGNSDPGVIGLGDTQVTVNESDGVARINVIRYDGSDGPATVFYQTVGNEAVDGQDFRGTHSGRIDFVDGQVSATIEIELIDDGDVETTETLSVSLFRAEIAGLGVPRTAIVSIVDSEAGSDLIGHWELNESSIGQAAQDASGYGNHGVHRNLNGPQGPRTDAPNTDTPNPRSLFFDGVDDYVSIQASDSLRLDGGTFTQSFWINSESTDNGYHGVLGYQSGTGSENRYPGIWVFDQTKIHAGFGDGSRWNSLTTGDVLTPGQWNHVATTFDGTTYKTFVNGHQVFRRANMRVGNPRQPIKWTLGELTITFKVASTTFASLTEPSLRPRSRS